MSEDVTRLLSEVDALVARGRRHEYVSAARRSAVQAGMAATWVEEAGRGAAREFDAARAAGREPVSAALPPREFQRATDQAVVHPVMEARRQRVNAALLAGKVTPAETGRIIEAMGVDEVRVTQLLADLPADRLPLEARAQVWGPDEIGPPLPPGDALPAGWSLLSASERAQLAERRGRHG